MENPEKVPINRLHCAALDAADPLAFARSRFSLPEGLVYLDGNSLGPLPAGVAERVAAAVEQEWGRGLIRSWNDAGWIDAPARTVAKLAPLIGAAADEVAVCDSTSVNLYKLLWAALQACPDRPVIVTEAGNFPTDRYLVEAVAAARGARLDVVPTADLPRRLEADDVGVVALTHVNYRSGARHDLAGLTAHAHGHGALTVWDLAHTSGAMDVDLNRAGADFAVGCGYKFLNGGPGAPGFAFVAQRHHATLRQPLPGWMGHRDPFAFAERYEPAPGAQQLAVGTPPILSLLALEAALDAFAGVDTIAVRAKSEQLTQLFIDLVDADAPGQQDGGGLALITPRNVADRGSQVTYRHQAAHAVMAALIARGVIGDVRGDLIRFGFAPLYVRFVDVWDAADHLAAVLATEEWRADRFQVRARVS